MTERAIMLQAFLSLEQPSIQITATRHEIHYLQNSRLEGGIAVAERLIFADWLDEHGECLLASAYRFTVRHQMRPLDSHDYDGAWYADPRYRYRWFEYSHGHEALLGKAAHEPWVLGFCPAGAGGQNDWLPPSERYGSWWFASDEEAVLALYQLALYLGLEDVPAGTFGQEAVTSEILVECNARARQLWQAAEAAEPPTDSWPELDLADLYEGQLHTQGPTPADEILWEDLYDPEGNP